MSGPWACRIKNALKVGHINFMNVLNKNVLLQCNIKTKYKYSHVNNGQAKMTNCANIIMRHRMHTHVGTFLSWFYSPLIDLHSLSWLRSHDEKNGGSPCSCDLRAHYLLSGVWLGEDSLASIMINGVDSSTTATEIASWVSKGLEIIYTVRGYIKNWQPIQQL